MPVRLKTDATICTQCGEPVRLEGEKLVCVAQPDLHRSKVADYPRSNKRLHGAVDQAREIEAARDSAGQRTEEN